MNESNVLWRNHARQWHLVGQPLRPAPEDARNMQGCIGPPCPDSGYCDPRTGLRHAMATGFIRYSVHFPGYELGERCPTFAWTPRNGASPAPP